MGKFQEFVRSKMPARVFTEKGQERYLHKDWDTPPTPQAVVDAGLAATIAEAQTLISTDKTLWGGTRLHLDLAAMEAIFGAEYPTVVPFGGKPKMFDKLMAADEERDGQGVKIGERGYKAIFAEWKNAGLIT